MANRDPPIYTALISTVTVSFNRKNDEKSSNFGVRDFQILRFSEVEMDQVTYEIPGDEHPVPGMV